MIERRLNLLGKPTALSWAAHILPWNFCTKCDIAERCKHKVLAAGVLPCQVLFIGEGPGENEDNTGMPFVGRAGDVLQKWIDQSLSVTQYSYAITNVVACRPTSPEGINRPPTAFEIENCKARLIKTISIANPKGIVLLGGIARDNLPNSYAGETLHLYHPAYMFRVGSRNSDLSDSQAARLTDWVKHLLEKK